MEVIDVKLDTREAAAYLGLKLNTLEIYRVQRRGPPYFKVGNRVRYAKSDLDAWLASRRFTCTSEYLNRATQPA